MTTSTLTTDMDALKQTLQQIWTAGDYDRFSRYLEGGAREFYDRLPVAPGAMLLDVGCGSGQLALIAAKDGLEVTGVDIAPNWVERARARAQAEGLRVKFDQGDAEALPYADKAFDLVVSILGAMFAPRPDLVAQELLRVCVPGGTVAMANWTPQGFVGRMFKIVAKFIAPSGMPSPVLWGRKPWSANDSGPVSPRCTWRGESTDSTIRFRRLRSWTSSANTMARSIAPVPRWTNPVRSAYGRSWNCFGPNTTGCRAGPRWWRRNTWKSSARGRRTFRAINQGGASCHRH